MKYRRVVFKNFRSPANKDKVQSFLGLVNFVSRYIPHMATLSFELRMLTKSNEKFVWSDKQQQAFDAIKQELSKDTVLGYFDMHEQTAIIADASPVGLGAVLYQNGKLGPRIIEYAHRCGTSLLPDREGSAGASLGCRKVPLLCVWN